MIDLLAQSIGMGRSIAEAIKQKKPFRSLEQEAIVSFLRTADVVRRHFDRVLAGHDLTLQQYNVLRILRGAGSQGLPTLEIGERLLERTPGVTRLVDRLEAKGLVHRRSDRGDRRRVICVASEEALHLLSEIDPLFDRADQQALGMLAEADQQALLRLCDAVRNGLEPA